MSERNVAVTLKVDVGPYRRAIKKAGESVHSFGVALLDKRSRRRHKRRCGICSPMSNPSPLSIDGGAYRRRTRKRGKR